MKISINSRNEIIGYAETGSISGAIESDVTIPSDFAPKKYLYADGAIVSNPDYDPPNYEAIKRIEVLKKSLEDTDYTVIKIAEGAATAAEYASVITQRQEWRAEINQLKNPI